MGLEGPGPTWTHVLLDVVSGGLVLTGLSFIAADWFSGATSWLSGALILLGVVCWGVDILVSIRATRRRQDPSG